MKTLLIILATILIMTVFTSSTFAHNTYFRRGMRTVSRLSHNLCNSKYSRQSYYRHDNSRNSGGYTVCPRNKIKNSREQNNWSY